VSACLLSYVGEEHFDGKQSRTEHIQVEGDTVECVSISNSVKDRTGRCAYWLARGRKGGGEPNDHTPKSYYQKCQTYTIVIGRLYLAMRALTTCVGT